MLANIGKETTKYQEVVQHDDGDFQQPENLSQFQPRSRAFFSYYSLLILVTVLLVFITSSLIWLTSGRKGDLNVICTKHISQYSPVVRDVGIRYGNIRFNGSLLKTNIFREDAGPAVDAAWASLGVNYRSLRIPPEEATRSNLLPDQVKINPKYGGGFPANVEGLHHLHCLNLLRQALYYNFDYYHALGEGPFRNDDHILLFHVTHCLDILRQQLMCSVDVGVLGQVWWDQDAPKAYVDFNTKHTCRNFQEIRKWAEEHQLPEEVPGDFLQPPKPGDTVYETIP